MFKQSETFKNQKPFKFGFIEEFLDRDFYEKLYDTYPKVDHTWLYDNGINKDQYSKSWYNHNLELEKNNKDEPSLSPEWNEFMKYVISDEFVSNFAKFSGVDVTKCREFGFTYYKRGGFQLPHIHNFGPHWIVMMIYFSKGWERGDPGGTFMSLEEDESTIIFEPYNLDNSVALFLDGPHSAHGARYITKNVERRACAISLDRYANNKWSGKIKNDDLYKQLLRDDKLMLPNNQHLL